MRSKFSGLAIVFAFAFVVFQNNLNGQVKTFSVEAYKIVESSFPQLPTRKIIDQNNRVLKLEFEFNSFNVHEIFAEDGETYQLFRINTFGLTNQVGSPAVPLRTEKIVLPENTNPVIHIESAEYIELKDYNIFPAQVLGGDGTRYNTTFTKDEKIYQTNDFFPELISEVTDIQVFRGNPIAFLQIRPMQYNPVTKTVRYYKKIRLSVEFQSGSKLETIAKPQGKRHDLQILRNTVINPESLPAAMNAGKAGIPVDPVGYIIVTVPQFEDAAEELATWKRQLGYHVEILSQNTWTIAQVKSAIDNLYFNSPVSFEYLLLMGDQDHIPDYYYENIYLDPILPVYSTNYYACMDGGNDFVPELAHGRIAIRDAAQASLVVNKIINYEKTPPSDPTFYQKGLVAGYFQDSTRDGTADKRYSKSAIDMNNYMTSLGYQNDLVLYTEPDVTPEHFNSWYTGETTIPSEYLKENGYAWDGDRYDVLNAWNDGRLFVFHRDHGLMDQWMQPNFTIYDMDNLTNGEELPIVFSINCASGLFYYPEPAICFSEKLQRHENGGAVGIVSATEETRSGYNDALIIGMMDAIWSDPGFIPDMGLGGENPMPSIPSHDPIYHMGDVMIQGLIRMTETWDNIGWADRDHFHLYHYFGDPAMRVWTEQPTAITANHSATLQPGTNTLDILSSNCPDGLATVCIGDSLVGQIILESGAGTVILDSIPAETTENIVLTISAPNYQPYISDIEVATEPVLTILPLGNSLTFDQYISDTRSDDVKISYRKDLFELLNEFGMNTNFVGTETSGGGLFPDPENAGFPAMTGAQLLHLLQTGYNQVAGTQETSGYYLDVFNPDVILLHIGTNGFTTDVSIIEEILDEIDAFKVRSGINTRTIIAQIINQVPFNTDISVFNANLQSLVSGRSDPDLFLVDMETGSGIVYEIAPNGDMHDTYHPEPRGFTKMAQVWMEGIGEAENNKPEVPVLLNLSDATVLLGEEYYLDFMALSEDPATLDVSGLVTGMNFDASLGILHWTTDQIGAFNLTVTATNSFGTATKEITVEAYEEILTPNPPVSISFSVSGNSVDISWEDQSDDETGFELERSTDGANFTQIATLAADIETHTDVVPELDVTYYYRVRAINSYGGSEYLTSSGLFVPSIPDYQVVGYDEVFGSSTYSSDHRRAQLVTMPEDGTIHKVSMYHGPGGNSLIYGVYADNNGHPGERLATTAVTPAADAEGWQEVDLTEPVFVEAGTDIWLAWVYEFTPMIRYTAANTSRAHSDDTFTQGMPSDFGASSLASYSYSIHALYQVVIVDPPPAAPTDLAAEYDESALTVSLTWSDNASNEEGFEIERSINGSSFTTLTTLSVNSTEYVDNTVTYNNIYEYRVFASNANGNSGYSNTVTVNTEYIEPQPPATPSNLTSDYDNTVPSIELAWQDNANDEDNFILERSINAGNFESLAILDSNSTSYADNTVEYSNIYTYRLFATNDIGESDTLVSDTIETLPPGPPDAPANIQLSVVGSSVEITWEDLSDDETGFELERSTDSINFSQIAVLAENTVSHTDSVPALDMDYYYRVRAVNTYGESGYAASSALSVPSQPEYRTVGYEEIFSRAVNTDNRRAQLVTMSEDGTIVSVSMYHTGGSGDLLFGIYSNNNGYPGLRIATTAATPVTSAGGWQEVSLVEPVFVEAGTDIWLAWVFETPPNIRFESAIATRAHSSDRFVQGMPADFGSSSLANYSYSIHALYLPGIVDPPPAAPTNLAAAYNESALTVSLTWSDNSSDEEGFEIERSINGSSFTTLTTLSVNSTEYVDNTVTYNNIYEYRVFASNANGNSGYSNTVTVNTEYIEPQPPAAPSNLTSDYDNTIPTIELAWQDNADDEDNFILERSVNAESYELLAILDANSASHTDNAVEYSNTYTYRLYAVNGVGNSDMIETSGIETLPPGPPDAPANIQLTLVGSSVEITWEDLSDDETGFELERSTNGIDFSQIAVLIENTVSHTDAVPALDMDYYYRVRALNAYGESVYATSGAIFVPSEPVYEIVGYDEVFASYTNNANRRAQMVTMSEAGTISKISMYHLAGDGMMFLGIYDDHGGLPGARIAVTNPTPVADADGWQEINLIDPVFISEGSVIWLAWVYENSGRILYTEGTPGRANSDDTYSSGMPSDFGASTMRDYNYSIHAVYQPVANNPIPIAPTDLAANYDETALTASLTWSDNASDEDGFEIERSVNGGSFASLTTLPANSTEYLDNTITYNNIYEYRVFASNANGNSGYSNTVTVNTEYIEPQPPAAPSDLTTSYDNTIPSIELAWQDNSDDEDNFILERSVNAGSYELLATLDANITSYTDNTVEYSNTYTYRLYAVNGMGNSDMIETSGIETLPPGPPDAPANIQLTLVGSSVEITWEDQSDDETGFELERSTDGINFSQIAILIENTVSHTDAVPALDMDYYYRVRAVNAYGESVYATSGAIFVPSEPVYEIVGYDEVFGSSSRTISTYRRSQRITMPENGTIYKVSMYHEAGDGSLIYGVYTDNGSGRPGTRIATTEITLAENADGWQEVDLTEPVFVEAGTNIWLAWVYENSLRIIYTSDASASRAHSDDTFAQGMPADYGSSSLANYSYSIHAFYLPGGGAKEDRNKSVSGPDRETSLEIFPNPIRGNSFNFVLSGMENEGTCRIEIFDITGRTVLNKEVWVEPNRIQEVVFDQIPEESLLLFRITNDEIRLMKRITFRK